MAQDDQWPRRIPPYAWGVNPVGQPLLSPRADPDAMPQTADLSPSTSTVPLADSDPALAFLRALKLLTAVLPSIFPPYDRAVLPFVFPLVNVPINVAPATAVTLGIFRVPPGHRGRVTAFGCTGSDLANLQWDFLLNGTPTPPITGMVMQYGTIPAPVTIPGPGIVVIESDTCEIRVTNIGVGIIANVQARADGYLWNPGSGD
jgi:hypothetical protein